MDSKNKGFTLIELLVVISIIAILSAVVLTSLMTARKKAVFTAFSQNVRQTMLAVEMYKEKHGQVPPSGGTNNQAIDALKVLVDEGLIRSLPTWPAEVTEFAYYPQNYPGAPSDAKCGETPMGSALLGVHTEDASFKGSMPQMYNGTSIAPNFYCFTTSN